MKILIFQKRLYIIKSIIKDKLKYEKQYYKKWLRDKNYAKRNNDCNDNNCFNSHVRKFWGYNCEFQEG